MIVQDQKKFVVLGGFQDGKFIDSAHLLRLYGLEVSECILSNSVAMLMPHHFAGRTVLGPRPDGNYSIPMEK